ncbi:hypothetical protein DK419_15985 [Methylobacterium terrae]|uniref:Uncharacterized protein n=1 Tax=Methylobacterium terrae TaxID=2202827 RepID=A0A2U8WMZ0_9HYPH|nr:DUF4150 domain-containing protein [Methylobacterium terrae]AWN47625.1 hypothetical protein DK419_15985 [Methylobacterium terrae]
MTWPREGSRDVRDGLIVSQVPDICLTPQGATMVPVPYTIWCRQADAAALADSIRQTDERTHTRGSLVLRCYGDEPGTGGGIRSGTTGAECTPKTWSSSVFVEGREMVRHDDEWWMNHRNTYGKLIYTKDMEQAEVADPRAIVPLMDDGRRVGAAAPEATSFAGPASSVGAAGAVIQGGRIVIPPLINGARAGAVRIAGVLVQIFTGARTSRKPRECPCVVAPYRQLQHVCAKACVDGQAHHIVPDFAKRYVSRAAGMSGQGRIRGLAGYYEGASICLAGQAKDDGSEHFEAHQADKRIEALGNNHPDTPAFPKGTARIEDIRDATEEQVKSVRPECSAQIESGIRSEFSGTNPNILGRTTIDRLPQGSALKALSNSYSSSTLH